MGNEALDNTNQPNSHNLVVAHWWAAFLLSINQYERVKVND
ncbi:hypothetical protein ACDZ28_10690 [Paenibacillus sp. RS8]